MHGTSPKGKPLRIANNRGFFQRRKPTNNGSNLKLKREQIGAQYTGRKPWGDCAWNNNQAMRISREGQSPDRRHGCQCYKAT